MKRINAGQLPVFTWCDPATIEVEALSQIRNLANLPFAVEHIAVMPDCHSGYGMPIGGVLATEGVIVPNAVGVDIGCGMLALPTGLSVDRVYPVRERILNDIQRSIPTGFNHHKKAQPWPGFDRAPEIKIIRQELDSARKQLGTLGGGNHFIEIQQGQDWMVWLMLHSGSRNFGKKVCDYYNKIAREKNFFGLDHKWQLWGLPVDAQEGREYLAAMGYCLEFSRANREHMLNTIVGIFERNGLDLPVRAGAVIDVQHNYASREEYEGHKLYIHRKGAVNAAAGRTVIIPGSMGTSSYICRGRGNPAAFYSCSHGAGRVLSRSEAKRRVSVEQVVLEMRRKDIAYFQANKKDAAEEASGAYKDIADVIEQQKDLVEVLHRLTPIGVVKG